MVEGQSEFARDRNEQFIGEVIAIQQLTSAALDKGMPECCSCVPRVLSWDSGFSVMRNLAGPHRDHFSKSCQELAVGNQP